MFEVIKENQGSKLKVYEIGLKLYGGPSKLTDIHSYKVPNLLMLPLKTQFKTKRAFYET